MNINWDKLSKRDGLIIDTIVKRHIHSDLPVKRAALDLQMDITAAHLHIHMNLEQLLAFDDFNFNHDIFGIIRNLNRETGKLENYFVPRSAR